MNAWEVVSVCPATHVRAARASFPCLARTSALVFKGKWCHFFHSITHRGCSARFCVGLKVGPNFSSQNIPVNGLQMLACPAGVCAYVCVLAAGAVSQAANSPAPRYLS